MAEPARRIMIRKYGRPSVLRTEPFEPEPPKDHEVQIKVRFTGVNFADLMQRMGLYQAAPKRPFVPGFEVSGHIAAVGSGVEGVAVGDEVAAVTRFGAYASHVNVAAETLLPMAGLSMQEAAAFPSVYLTAWEALVVAARAREGDKVLVHGGAGGVGLAAIGIAQYLGCNVYATAGSNEKTAWLEAERGVTKAYNYREEGWDERIKAEAGDMDIILEPGGPARFRRSRRLLGPMGHVVLYGMQEATPSARVNPIAILKAIRGARISLMSLIPRGMTLSGFHLLYLWSAGADLRGEVEKMLPLIGSGQLPRPVVDKVFPIDEAPAAHQYIHDRKNVGKVLLDWG